MERLYEKVLRRVFCAAVLLAVLLLAAGCAPSAPAAEPTEPTEHVHRWSHGVCGECGAVCAHVWRGGVCTVCDRVCRHEWLDGVCTVCGLSCTHRWREGVCTRCGEVCEHVWREGVCAVCGTECPHEKHNANSLRCEDCGEKAPHAYLNGVCTRCGRRPSFLDRIKPVPENFLVGAEAHGATETFHFALREGEILPGPRGDKSVEERRQREMVVYTPADYDPEKQYNVVIISPGAGHNAHFWMERANRMGSAIGRIEGRELLDRLIEQGVIEPMIVVTVEYYHLGTPAVISVTYGRDLRERVLPYLAEHYATYASIGEDGEFIAAPEHFAYVGASFGAMIGWQLMPKSTDLFSFWGLLSGGFSTEEEMAYQINNGIWRDYPIHWLYAGDGERAQGWVPYLRKIEAVDKSCDCLAMDKNLSFLAVKDTEHEVAAWDVGLINCLQVFFHSRFDPTVEQLPVSGA